MITLDFETEAIVGNPIINPPHPVGLAVLADDMDPRYVTDWDEMNTVWHWALEFQAHGLLFHNMEFDLAVGLDAFGGQRPHWKYLHDTMYMIYLADPYARHLGLKPSADRYLDLPPEEQDDLYDWIVANVPEATRKNAGAFISRAPVALVKPYAEGDVRRTLGLYNYFKADTPAEPYARERRLSPILVAGTKQGIRVDRAALEEDVGLFEAAQEHVDSLIRGKLGCGLGVNLNSGQQLAEALSQADAVTHWHRTPTGLKSTNKDFLKETIRDPELRDLLLYQSALKSCVGTFMHGWLRDSERDGRLHTSWNAIRNTEAKRVGTRTGRLSSSNPNLQNVTTEYDVGHIDSLPDLPFMRRYLMPEEGCVWLKRDWSSQELRIAAHFEEGPLYDAYRATPDLDPHQMTKELIYELTSYDFPRLHVKTTGFQIIYGGGVPAISTNVGCDRPTAMRLKGSYFAAMPGIKELIDDVCARGKMGESITTWGGRTYFAEEKRYAYKLVNYLIQGSAADQAKECIVDWDENYNISSTFLAMVHDELNISAPVEKADQEMLALKQAMEQPLFDVPMLTEGFMGMNWHDLTRTL